MKRPITFSHEAQVALLAFLSGVPPLLLCGLLLWFGGYSPRVQETSLFLLGSWILLCCLAVRNRVAGPLRTVASLLDALRLGDYSIRGRVDNPREPLGEVMEQVNAMAAILQAQRLGALEATALLRKVMEEIDIATFAFDPAQALRLVNRAGERLLGEPEERLTGKHAKDLHLAEYLVGPADQTVTRAFAGLGAARWHISRSQFREGGVAHKLLVVTDLTRPLREEELKAWQRLVRVLGHELNNSLTPIKSIAQSLESLLKTEPRPEDWEDDTARGLHVIAARSESLSRFMSSYAALAKLPPPTMAPVPVNELIGRVTSLEQRIRVFFEQCPPVTIPGDADQLEQALINLVRNAVDAVQETGGRVFIKQQPLVSVQQLEITVRDEGRGLLNTANLFVPFFTTKRGGSGIGLVLSRQIAEAHNGSLVLQNASQGPGCEAVLRLPLR